MKVRCTGCQAVFVVEDEPIVVMVEPEPAPRSAAVTMEAPSPLLSTSQAPKPVPVPPPPPQAAVNPFAGDSLRPRVTHARQQRHRHRRLLTALDAARLIRKFGGGGRVIGSTSEGGNDITNRPVPVADFMRIVCHALGIDPRKENQTPIGRPIRIVDGGNHLRELFTA